MKDCNNRNNNNNNKENNKNESQRLSSTTALVLSKTLCYTLKTSIYINLKLVESTKYQRIIAEN